MYMQCSHHLGHTCVLFVRQFDHSGGSDDHNDHEDSDHDDADDNDDNDDDDDNKRVPVRAYPSCATMIVLDDASAS